jgi:predicted ATPase
MKIRAPFVDRLSELALLRHHLETAHAGTPQIVLMEGAPGIGKSALLEAFAKGQERRVRRRVRFYYLSAPDGEEYSPIHHVAMAATDHRHYRRLGGKRQATRIARGMLREWLAAIPIWGNLMAAIAATWQVLNRRRSGWKPPSETGDEFVEALLAESRRRPLVLLLDQLEAARSESIDHLERLVADASTGCRLLVVGAYRPPPPGGVEPPIVKFRRRLADGGAPHSHFRLGALEAAAVGEAVQLRFSGAVIPEGFVEWLHATTGGHPQLVQETLTHLQRTRSIRRELGRWRIEAESARLDSSVESDFAELDGVEAHLRDILAVAASFGEEFEVLDLAHRLGRDELDLEDELAGAGHLGLVEYAGEREHLSGDITTVYRFTSSHLRAELARRGPAGSGRDVRPSVV